VLGPLRVVDEYGSSSISAPKIELLLAALLIRVDQLVPADHLVSEIWDQHPPRRVTAGLHVYVSQLRKFLGRPMRPNSPIVTRPPGYQLELGPDELDAHTFLRLAKAGRQLHREGNFEAAADHFERALALWRGLILGDLQGGQIVNGFVTRLNEERLEIVELMLDARLALGRHRELTGQLYALTRDHPLRESFYRQLMVALYRSERQADALKVYQDARRTLKQELGLEPCRALQELHRAILTGDRNLDLRAWAAVAA
jgi:DNA-binding SARP family transcriptional activator